jgi:hypothetical protein
MTNEQEIGYERAWRRQRSRDVLSTVVWALIFIWTGLVLLAENLGYLGWLQVRVSDLPGAWRQFGVEAWPLIFLGAGALVLVEVVLRLTVPAFRRPIVGRVIVAIFLIGIGLGNLTNWALIWPAMLILLGVSMLLGGFFRGR